MFTDLKIHENDVNEAGNPYVEIEPDKGKCTALPYVGIQNFGMWGMYNLAKAYKSIQKPIANRRVEDWEASDGHTN